MKIMNKKLEAVIHLIVFHFLCWVLSASIITLSWNYLLADFFGLEAITIPVAIGILLLKNALLMNNQTSK